jgi:hypothetical protein
MAACTKLLPARAYCNGMATASCAAEISELMPRWVGLQTYFLGAQGLPGAQGLSEPFFFFFLAGPHGLSGPQGFAALLPSLLSLVAVGAASAAITAGAGATKAVATISADRVSANLRRDAVCCVMRCFLSVFKN